MSSSPFNLRLSSAGQSTSKQSALSKTNLPLQDSANESFSTNFSLDAFFEEPLQDIAAIFSHINSKVFTPADCRIDLQAIHSYNTMGLLELSTNSASAHSAHSTQQDSSILFSFQQKVWISIIGQMECFGFSSETMLQIKQSLFSQVTLAEVFTLIASCSKTGSQAKDMLQRSPLSDSDRKGVESLLQERDQTLSVSISLFELLLVQAIAVKQESCLMLLPCGTVIPLMDEMLLLDERISLLKMQPHLSLSLNSYILEHVSRVPTKVYASAFKLSPEELEVIRQLRSGLYKEVKVELKQSDPVAIEMVQDKTIAKGESFSLDKMVQSDRYHKVSYTSNHQRGGHLQRIYRKKFTPSSRQS